MGYITKINIGGVVYDIQDARVDQILVDIATLQEAIGQQLTEEQVIALIEAKLSNIEAELSTKQTEAQVRAIIETELGVIENGNY